MHQPAVPLAHFGSCLEHGYYPEASSAGEDREVPDVVPFIVTAQCDIGKEALDLLVLLHSKCEKPQPDPRLILSLTIQRAVARAQLWAAKRCHGSRFRRGDFVN